jgi:hypothetical protein
VGTRREAKKLARLVVTVVFPEPPLELMTSVVFIAMAIVPLRADAMESLCQGHAAVLLTTSQAT